MDQPGGDEGAVRDHPRSTRPGLNWTASLNAGASALDYVARAVVEFVVNPILVAGLGSFLYGAWRTLWRMTGYLWAASGRSGQALQIAVARRQRDDDDHLKQRLVGAAVAVWFAFLPLLLIIGAVGVWFVPELIDTPARYVTAVRWTAALLWLDSVALSLFTLPKSVLQGENLGFKRMGLTTALVIGGGVGTAVAVEMGAGIVGVAVVNLANTVLTGALFLRVVKQHVPWFGFARPHRAEFRSFLGVSAWFTGWKFVNQLLLAGDVAILAIAGSVTLVTDYTLTKFAPEATLPLLSLAVQGVMPGLGGILGADEHERSRRLRGEIITGVWLLATAAAVGVLVLNRSFVDLWVGGRYFAGDVANLLIVLSFLQLAVIRTDAAVIDLTMRIERKVLVGALSVGLTIVFGVVALRTLDLGIAGLVGALILGRSVLTFMYPRMVGAAVGVSMASQIRAAVRPVLAAAVLIGTAYGVGTRIEISSWLVLVPAGVVVGALAVPVAAVLGLTVGQRGALISRIDKARRRV